MCHRAQHAAGTALGRPVTVAIADRDPANLECRLRAGGVRLDVVAQATADAWVEFDTTESHQAQVYGSGVHQPDQIPVPIATSPAQAMWIPAQREVFATNASPTRGGSYVTVTVGGRRGRLGRLGRSPRRVAGAVALATVAAAPRGPKPGASS